MKRTLSLVAAAATLVVAAGCSTPSSPSSSNVPVAGSGTASQVTRYGVVRSINVVDRQAAGSGAGAVLGAVLGGVLGNQVGSGSGRTVATVGGAVAGAVAGNEVEKRTRAGAEVYRVDVQFENGETAAFDFNEINGLRVGDRVRYEGNQLYRL